MLVYRMGTHMSQRHPEEVEEEATNFLNEVRTKVIGPHRDKRWIINMDQTLVYFTMNQKTTLNTVGARTVHVHTSTNDTKRATVAVTITASGHLLPAVTVFKGKPAGRIAKTEFATYPAGHFYSCQKNAWMDEQVMGRESVEAVCRDSSRARDSAPHPRQLPLSHDGICCASHPGNGR